MENNNGAAVSEIPQPQREVSDLSWLIKNGLVIVNFIALFILIDKVYATIAVNTSGNTTTLLQAALATGALGIGGFLYALVGHKGKPFAALFLTYFLAGVIILARVLGNIFLNIWTNNMTVAIYIILGIIVISLGMFIYFHNKND